MNSLLRNISNITSPFSSFQKYYYTTVEIKSQEIFLDE